MASQEGAVEGQPQDTTVADDNAKFSEAWDQLEAEVSGQPDLASGRQDEGGKDGSKPGGDEAGQGEAKTGQSEAGTTPDADADKASRGETTDNGTTSAGQPDLAKEREARIRAENLARSNGGRLAKALNELSALQKQLADKAGAEGGEATSDEVETLRREYPDVANPLLKQIDKLTERVEALSTTATARAESEVADALTSEAETLAALHSDVAEIVKQPEYAEWVKGQAPMIQRIVQENSKAVVSAADCAMVFDLYKASKGVQTGETAEQKAAREAAERRQSQLDAGRSATGGTQPGVRSDAGGDGSYDDEWERLDRAAKTKAASRK
jgi:hypothetical protein